MTGCAIDRHLLLLVALDTVTHVQIHFAFRRSLLRHITVAGGAIYSCSNVGCMIESHMSRVAVVVYPHPWNLFNACLISGNLLDFRFFRSDRHVAGHTELHIGNLRVGSLIDSNVASSALKSIGEVDGVRVGNWLHRVLRMHIKKISESTCNGWMRRGEFTAGHKLR